MKTLTLAFALLPAAVLARAPMSFDLETRKTVRCTFKTIEKRECVYRCADGTAHRTPINEPTPTDPAPIACPQIIWRF
jgi:hypothetical protein